MITQLHGQVLEGWRRQIARNIPHWWGVSVSPFCRSLSSFTRQILIISHALQMPLRWAAVVSKPSEISPPLAFRRLSSCNLVLHTELLVLFQTETEKHTRTFSLCEFRPLSNFLVYSPFLHTPLRPQKSSWTRRLMDYCDQRDCRSLTSPSAPSLFPFFSLPLCTAARRQLPWSQSDVVICKASAMREPPWSNLIR